MRFLLIFVSSFSISSHGEAPSIIPKVEFRGIKNISNAKERWILKEKIKSAIAYYYLYNEKNDLMEMCNYIHSQYTNWRINEKNLLHALLKLGKNPNNISLILELRDKMEKFFPKSEYLWFGDFILALHYLSQIGNNPKDNFNNISNIVFALGTMHNNRKYKTIIFYIANYYLSEHYLFLMKEHFYLRDFNEVMVYGQKVLMRFNIHPRSAMEALVILIETFAILEAYDLVDYYGEVLVENVKLSPVFKPYVLRLKYLKQIYYNGA